MTRIVFVGRKSKGCHTKYGQYDIQIWHKTLRDIIYRFKFRITFNVDRLTYQHFEFFNREMKNRLLISLLSVDLRFHLIFGTPCYQYIFEQ